MDENEKPYEQAAQLGADLTCSLANKQIPVSEAVRIVDAFTEGLKGKLPAETWLEVKAKLLGDIFSLREVQDARQHAATEIDEDIWLARQVVAAGLPAIIVNVQKEGQLPLWQIIKARKDAPEKCDKSVWLIGFLTGLENESVLARDLEQVWETWYDAQWKKGQGEA